MSDIKLTRTLRLPDSIQKEALNFLEASKVATNFVIETLWNRLDEIKGGENQAWKQITAMIEQPHKNGNRQWRGEAETAGRILRSQASRKEVFEKILPILTDEIVFPMGEKRKKAHKNKKVMLEKIGVLREELADDAEKLAYMINVTEQACNFYIENNEFPKTYEEIQSIPVLKTGLFTYAADDGGIKGQTYRYSIEGDTLFLKLKTPDEKGKWRWIDPIEIKLSKSFREFVTDCSRLAAPTLRAVKKANGDLVAYLDIIVERPPLEQPEWETQENVLGFDWGVRKILTCVVLSPDGDQISRPFYLNTGGFDGKQARTRRQIDKLKSKRDALPKRSRDYKRVQGEIDLNWNAYEKRNQVLAHFCSNYLLMLAKIYGCHAIAGEWLKTLKSEGRGRYTKSRWRNWRNNTTIRSAITTKLKYKCSLSGVKLRFEQPRNTSHTCPHCGQHADTYKSPEHNVVNDWGAWLKCAKCGWNGSRDYAASINIARLAVAFFKRQKENILNNKEKSYAGYRIDNPEIKPASYIGAGTALPLLPSVKTKKVFISIKCKPYFSGWRKSATMSPVLPTNQPKIDGVYI